MVFNKAGKAIAAQYTSGNWIELGQVTGSAGSSNSGTVNGVSYDHVVPVEREGAGGEEGGRGARRGRVRRGRVRRLERGAVRAVGRSAHWAACGSSVQLKAQSATVLVLSALTPER